MVLISLYWAHSHFSGKLLEKTDHGYNLLSIGFLAVVSITPFPARPLVEHLSGDAENTTAALWYLGVAATPATWWFLRWVSAIVIDSSMDMQGTFLNSAFLTDGGDPRFTIRGGAYQYKRDQQSYDGYVSGPVPLFGRDHELVIGVSHRSRLMSARAAAPLSMALLISPRSIR